MATATDDLLTPRQIADYIGVTDTTVYRWIKNGQLAAVRIGGTVRVKRTDLDRVLNPDPTPAP